MLAQAVFVTFRYKRGGEVSIVPEDGPVRLSVCPTVRVGRVYGST